MVSRRARQSPESGTVARSVGPLIPLWLSINNSSVTVWQTNCPYTACRTRKQRSGKLVRQVSPFTWQLMHKIRKLFPTRLARIASFASVPISKALSIQPPLLELMSRSNLRVPLFLVYARKYGYSTRFNVGLEIYHLEPADS